jgi:CubicO group peptidase (beta-lactamase class C family)
MIDAQTTRAWCDRIAAPYRHDASGVIVAILGPDLEHYQSYGRIDHRRNRPPDADTVFEIGSITKVFTAILAATLAEDGRIDLDAPIGTIATEFAGAPDWITPRSLSSHTSGLPRLTLPLWRAVWMSDENPYASIGREDLVRWMAAHRPRRAPMKGQPRYSNLGAGQ